MANNIPKPENALKRAEELIAVQQHAEALNVLHGTISHRRLKVHGWDTSTELIMLRYVRLCVELNKLKLVREGLHYYRYLTHQHSVVSLAKVMKKFRELSEAKLEAVKLKADAEALARGVEDLEADETPENLLLAALQVEVRDDTAKSLHAALLGCWETYKILLDLLRFAPKIDYLYHNTAQRALEFCRTNRRPLEFRRLCETLRMHYLTFQRNRSKPDYEALIRPESHLGTKLTQMVVAADLSLWTQCFQTAEDILSLGLHELLQRSLITKDPALHKMRSVLLSQTALFYEKLAQMFLVSGQHLFHAAATLRHLFHVRQHKRNLTEAEQIRLCDVGTISVLSAPVVEKQDQTAADLEYQKRLASMLAHSGVPTRASMQHIIETRNVVASASVLIQELYSLIEGEIDPMNICKKTQNLLDQLKDVSHVAPYIFALKQVVFNKLMLRLYGIYLTISIDFFTTCVCPDTFLPWSEAEALIVRLIDQGIVKIRIDYAKNLLIFTDRSATSSDHSLKNQLVHIASVLSELLPQMHIPNADPYLSQVDQSYNEFYLNFSKKLQDEAERLSQRNRTIANRRLKQEKEQQEKEEARRTKEKEKQKKEELEEQNRREAALKYQETIRRKEAQQQLKIEISKQILSEFKSIADRALGKIIIKGRPIDEITAEQIMNNEYTYEDYEKAQDELKTRERQEKNRQYRLELKRIEHIVRAIREEETHVLPLWKERIQKEDMEIEQKVLQLRKLKAQEEHAKNVRLCESIQNYLPLIDQWAAEKLIERENEYLDKVQKRKTQLQKMLKKDKIERAKARRDNFIAKTLEEELSKKKKEEELRRKEEDAARARAAEKQRLKDKEIEERAAAAASASASASAAASAVTTTTLTRQQREPLPQREPVPATWRRPQQQQQQQQQTTTSPRDTKLTDPPALSRTGKYVAPGLRTTEHNVKQQMSSTTENKVRKQQTTTSDNVIRRQQQHQHHESSVVDKPWRELAREPTTVPITTTSASTRLQHSYKIQSKTPPQTLGTTPDSEGFTVVSNKQKPKSKE